MFSRLEKAGAVVKASSRCLIQHQITSRTFFKDVTWLMTHDKMQISAAL